MKKYTLLAVIAFAFVGGQVQPAYAVSKETLQILQELDDLKAAIQALQTKVDTQGSTLKALIDQSTDGINTMKATVTDMHSTIQQSTAANGVKFDGISTQMQQLSESVDETKARVSKLNDLMTQIQNQLTNIPANPPAGGGSGPAGPPGATATPVPTADSLYAQGQTYYMGGQYDLAMQAFQDYLKYYSDTDRASNAQFYIGECFYSQKNYKDAISAYDACIEKYPAGNKASAAQLKKGYALLEAGEKPAGIRELRSLIQRAPDAPESDLARQRLKKLGVASSTARAR